MNYKVVLALDKSLSEALKSIAREVEELCSYGWKLQEGISVVLNINYYYVCQAMVK